ncbi:hypothetical protein AAFF_G00268820 [Aldrovandia affinis]|uniref:Uncharacterized protein n=1 Tax=Aldrovandia affinis TaxID=143900 RepID=A0AAD7STF0_9TELE|nr:hypothetical protein AAFF_G00268820 [Aldrovandia affinis]
MTLSTELRLFCAERPWEKLGDCKSQAYLAPQAALTEGAVATLCLHTAPSTALDSTSRAPFALRGYFVSRFTTAAIVVTGLRKALLCLHRSRSAHRACCPSWVGSIEGGGNRGEDGLSGTTHNSHGADTKRSHVNTKPDMDITHQHTRRPSVTRTDEVDNKTKDNVVVCPPPPPN